MDTLLEMKLKDAVAISSIRLQMRGLEKLGIHGLVCVIVTSLPYTHADCHDSIPR